MPSILHLVMQSHQSNQTWNFDYFIPTSVTSCQVLEHQSIMQAKHAWKKSQPVFRPSQH